MPRMSFIQRPKIGLALSGGSARGFAHVGVIRVLEQAGIPIDYVAGTSMGALIGAFYAAGKSATDMMEIAGGIDRGQLLRLLDPSFKGGLIAGDKVLGLFDRYLQGATFEKSRVPLRIVATDLRTGDPVVYSDGELLPAVRASISLPLVFDPVTYRGQLLSDGGLSLPLPTRVVREMGADIVLAVNVLAHMNTQIADNARGIHGMLGVANASLSVVMRNLAIQDAEAADVVIEPDASAYESHQFDQARPIIEAGVQAATEKLPAIASVVAAKTPTLAKFIHSLHLRTDR